MELINVKRYYPEHKPYGEDVQYFQSEDGRDFYESIPLFTKKYKLCISPVTGIICSVAEDVSALYPAGFTVVEADELPEGTDISGNWKFDNGVISRIPVNYARKLEAMRQSYLNQAYEKINDWRTELQLGTISDEDRAALTRWMAYISQVKKMEPSAIKTEAEFDAIKWPEQPE
ncbi:tail fiber assembly protein [Escherichia coli]|nr:tail fiber assembly protein [Escherichia coli]EHZ6134302.1 tail fiber assembly protein [Escherichia coli]HCB8747532.1 tail fiber assembly protein [Escherichia coli]